MIQKIKIFGYGSLLNLDSLKETVPNVGPINPVYLKDYIRVFDKDASNKQKDDGKPVNVLNLKKISKSIMNGICFEVNGEYLQNLKEREKEYFLINVDVVDIKNENIIRAKAFYSSRRNSEEFSFNDSAQIEYLKICLEGARNYGGEFYDMFLDTTYIDDIKLKDHEKISHLI